MGTLQAVAFSVRALVRQPAAESRHSRGPRHRPVVRTRVVVLVVGLAVGAVPFAASAQPDTPAEEAAQEIQAARDRANDAAEAYFQAESALDLLEDELIRLEALESELQAEVDALRSEVEGVAVSRYVASGTKGIPLLTDIAAPQDQIQAEVLVDILTNTGADAIDRFDAAEKALAQTQDEVAARQRDIEEQKIEFARLEVAATEEVERLRAIEKDRLEDEAVQRALDAQVAEERARLEEQARLDAEAAARAQPNPGLVVPPTTLPPPPTTTVPPIDGEFAADGTPAADGSGDGTVDGVAPPPVDTTPETTQPPASTLPPNSGGSGGSGGGRTGGGGGGSSPGGVATGSGYLDNIICPMPGSAYADTWGAPRSGGRRHEGVDMIAPRGIPIYAVTAGFVTFKTNRLGGNAVSLVGDNGNRYYYAHLDRYEGSSRRVNQGDVIGYNGDTGNAKFSTPHLHFQIHPGGGLPTNPTPSVRAAGC